MKTDYQDAYVRVDNTVEFEEECEIGTEKINTILKEYKLKIRDAYHDSQLGYARAALLVLDAYNQLRELGFGSKSFNAWASQALGISRNKARRMRTFAAPFYHLVIDDENHELKENQVLVNMSRLTPSVFEALAKLPAGSFEVDHDGNVYLTLPKIGYNHTLIADFSVREIEALRKKLKVSIGAGKDEPNGDEQCEVPSEDTQTGDEQCEVPSEDTQTGDEPIRGASDGGDNDPLKFLIETSEEEKEEEVEDEYATAKIIPDLSKSEHWRIEPKSFSVKAFYGIPKIIGDDDLTISAINAKVRYENDVYVESVINRNSEALVIYYRENTILYRCWNKILAKWLTLTPNDI